MRNRVRAVLSGFVVSCEAKNTKQGATGRAQGILASATMGVSAMFTGFTKRYSAKYIQTGSFTPVLHFMAVSALTHLSIKYVVVGQHKSAQMKEETKKIHDFHAAHHVGAHH